MADSVAHAVPPEPYCVPTGPVDPSTNCIQIHVSPFAFHIPGTKILMRNAKRSIMRMGNVFARLVFPIPTAVAFGTVVGEVVRASVGNNREKPTGMQTLSEKIPLLRALPRGVRVGCTTLGIIAAVAWSQRMLLRRLLSYTAWLSAGRGPRPIGLTLWSLLMKYVYVRGCKTPAMYAFDSSLPTFPLPSLKDTVERFIKASKPLRTESEMAEIEADAKKFLRDEGPKLQKYLRLKWLTSRNYVSEFWLRYVYLAGRDSLLINSSVVGLGLAWPQPKATVASRVAYFIRQMFIIRREFDQEKWLPMGLPQRDSLVPLDMSIYRVAFNTSRVPMKGEDKLVHYDSSEVRHTVVEMHGRFYKVLVFSPTTGEMVSLQQLEDTIQGIVDDKSEASEAEQKLMALTTMNRDEWAKIREEEFLSNPANRAALKMIESGALFITINTKIRPPSPTDLTALVNLNWGSNHWMDKTDSYLFLSDGNFLAMCEHAWGDGTHSNHVSEVTVAREFREMPYALDGRLKTTPAMEAWRKAERVPAQRLHFEVRKELADAIFFAQRDADRRRAELDCTWEPFIDFGRIKMSKVAKCSPDAFVQMAIQLAYYRLHKTFVDTYESGLTRIFAEGRTETIRSVTQDSCDWVRAMELNAPREKVAAALQKACRTHSTTTVNAMAGKGIDRHLFALFVVMKGTRTESPFLQHWRKREWLISSSQTTQTQSHHEWRSAKDIDTIVRPVGGFGPVAATGYGLSYNIAFSDQLFMMITCFKPSGRSAALFNRTFQTALRDMMGLFGDGVEGSPLTPLPGVNPATPQTCVTGR